MAEEPSVVVADAVSEILYSIAGLLLIGFGLMGAVAAVAQAIPTAPGSIGPATILFGISVLLVAIGAVVTPIIRRRLDRRHSPTEFGQVRTVDRRVVREQEDEIFRCTACDSPAREGLVRRYREEYAVAGPPLHGL